VAHCLAALAGTNDAAEIPVEEAIAHAEAGRDMASRLVDEYPFVSEFRRVRGLAGFYAGCRYLLTARFDEARAALEAARDDWQHLCETSDGVQTHRMHLARSRVMLAVVDRSTGRPDAALEGLLLAEKELGDVVRKTDSDAHRVFLAATLRQIGLVHLGAGRLPEAAAATKEARNILAPLRAKVTHLPRLRIELAACHATLSELAGKPGTDIPPADGPTEANRATELLRANLTDYYPHPFVLTRDPGFESLRGRDDFGQLVRGAGARVRSGP
jgi:hypothetical protein